MPFIATSTSGVNSGTSSMGSNTALSRTVTTLSGAHVLTSFDVSYQVSQGAGAGSYNTFTTGATAQSSNWQVALSWVPTGDSVPNLFTAQDDPHFLWVDFPVALFDRNTINTAGTPSYKDLYMWGGRFHGRVQIPFSNGGTLNWHVTNITPSTVVTFWAAGMRCHYV